jgi:BCD family chlorophyll transporter-like MFS transporter
MNAFWIIGLAALFLGAIGLIRLEDRSAQYRESENLSWAWMFRQISGNRQAMNFFWYLTILLAAILGQDILLEPFGAEAFGLTVTQTTRITSIWGTCVLAALLVAGGLEGRVAKRTVVRSGAWVALVGFITIAASGVLLNLGVFYSGVVLLGIGTGLSTVSNLSLMLDMTTIEKVGLFIGAWGMSNALSRLIGTVLSGVVRDLITQVAQNPLTGYLAVFIIEAAMIIVSLLMLRKIDVQAFRRQADEPSLVERAAIASEF